VPIEKEANKKQRAGESLELQSAEAGVPDAPELQSTLPAMKAKPPLDKSVSQPDSTAAVQREEDADEGKSGASRP
jgi:hypothetical protein